MSGGVFVRFSRGRRGASGAHLGYITRPGATDRAEHAIVTRHLPSYAEAGQRDEERRASLRAYAEQREADEQARPFRGGHGESRTHYRLVLSCEGRVDTERLQGMVQRYLDERLPTARTVSVVHQDTAHTHAHVWVDARDIHDRKLQFDERSYRRLDEAWAREYGREFGRDKEAEHLAKKAETRAWREEYARARAEGRTPPPVPERAERALGRDAYQAREERTYGADQGRTGGDQRGTPGREHAAAGRDQPAGARAGDADRAERAVADAHQAAGAVERAHAAAVREAAGLRDELARLRERDEIERSR